MILQLIIIYLKLVVKINNNINWKRTVNPL
jgi:hypothetical protein